MPWFGGVQAETLRPDKRIVKTRVVKDRDKQQPETMPVRFGKIPAGHYLIAETVVVDYRDDEPSRMRLRGELTGPMPLIGAMPLRSDGGGANSGTVATGGCTYDIECDDGHPCTLDVCNMVIGAPVGTGKCVNTVLANGDVGECDDGVFCNGIESCQGSDGVTPGTCTAGAVPCAVGESCNEDYQCHPICTLDTECDDGLGCNGLETCVDGACIAGDNPCGPNADCVETVCQGCGPGCNGYRACEDDGDCTGNQGEIGTCTGPLTCFYGRCCTTTDSGVTYGCSFARGVSVCSGLWYAGDGGRLDTACGPTAGGCPKYSGGIAPHGDFLNVIGPVSDSIQPVPNAHGQGVGPATPLNKLGDDYQLSNHSSFLNLQFFRYVGGQSEPGFAIVEIYDEHGHFIEDALINIQDNSIAIRVIEFDPPLIIPSRGFIVLRNASNYSPNAHLYWLSTDVVDVGVNDPDVLWVNGGLQGEPDASMSNFLTGPGILAFELVGLGDPYNGGNDKIPAPLGACCDKATGTCSEITEWECKGTGGTFSGIGAVCAQCGGGSFALGAPCRTCDAASTNVNDPCYGDFDCDGGACVQDDAVCKTCDNDSVNAGDPCSGDEDCDGGLCIGTCDIVAGCETGACCDVATGDCVEDTTLESCDGAFQGFGTDCRSSCCTQPVDKWRDPNGDANNDGVPDGPWSGGDSCDDAYVHQFTIIPGNPPVGITITGDNNPASSTLENPDSCPTYFNNEDSDRGWWEAFHIDACAYVWIDKCCTHCDGECSAPWPMIFNACPCQGSIQSVQPEDLVCPECSILQGFRCSDGNGFNLFGPLPAGTYYYPVASGVGDHIGSYQMHINVESCPIAACCVQDQCQLVNRLACDAAGGFFLAEPNQAETVLTCDNDPNTGTCTTGSCCTGPGSCVDRDGLGDPFTLEECNVESGKYVGGISCHGGYCSLDPTISCNNDDDCNRFSWNGSCLGDEPLLAQPSPCPICEFQGRNNCQPVAEWWTDFLPSDLGMTTGFTLADDFIPNSNEISQVCVFGFYLRVDDPSAPAVDPDCDDDVGGQDHFRVRVYENSFLDLPGALLGESTVTNYIKTPYSDSCANYWFCDDGSIDLYGIQFTLDTPISVMVLDGRRYWLEVANDLSAFDDCNWWWISADPLKSGNGYRAMGSAGFYESLSGSVGDQAFCINSDFHTPATPVYPCCRCLDGTCLMATLEQCRAEKGFWHNETNTCSEIDCTLEQGPPANDECADMELISSVPYKTTLNSFCATTDGYNPIQSELGPASMGNDVWYTYTPTERCVLTASMCASGSSYDSFIALYDSGTDGDSVCQCPLGADLTTHALTFIEASDESCVGELIGAAGTITTMATAGTCYLIRAGGFLSQGNAQGSGILDVDCVKVIPTPVLPDPDGPGSFACDGGDNYGLPCMTCNGGSRDAQLCMDDLDCGGGNCVTNHSLCNGGACSAPFPWPKSRYIGFKAGTDSSWVDQQIAIRVKMIDVKDHPECTDQVRWVGPPTQYCESGACTTTFMASTLQNTPYFTDWTLQGVVQVMGEEIVPQSRYVLQAIFEGTSNNLVDESNYSTPALWVDTAKWGDVIRPFDRFTAAGQPQISDVLALVDKWLGNLEPRKARAQLQPQIPNPGADVGIADILKAVDAWLGSPYPYPIDSCGP